MNITLILIVSVMLLYVLALAIQSIQNNLIQSTEKWIAFECGFNTINPSHIPFSFQFFLIAILFLIFDVEISLVLAFPLESSSTNNMTIVASFLAILTIGLLYEWQNGNIDWSN